MGEGPDWEHEAFLRLAEDTSARVSVVREVDDDAVFEWTSRSAAAGLGFRVADLVGRSFRDIYPVAAAEDVLSHIATARARGRHSYEAVRDLPGGRQSVRVDVLPIGDGRYVLSSLDVSAEREARRRLEGIARTARIGVYQWNVVDDEWWWSDELYRILGYQPGEVAPGSDRLLERTHPDDVRIVTVRADDARHGRRPLTGQYRMVTTTGAVRVVESKAETTRDEDGRVLYVLGTVQDITERVALEHEAEALRAAAERQHTALEVHDRVVQGLATVWLALDLGDLDRARAAAERATADAQEIVAELLAQAEARGGLRPGDLANDADDGGAR